MQPQVEGRSLVPLLSNPAANWEDRYLFSHFGRWPKFADPNDGKFKMAAVRDTRWAMVNDAQGGPEKWQLFDLKMDYAQQHNVIEQHPAVAQELRKAFDQWWAECLPLMVNEQVVGPEINPFQTLYYQQFGGSPTPGDLERMKPNRPNAGEAPKGKQKKAKASK